MSYSKKNIEKNQNIHHKRTLRNHQKCPHWQTLTKPTEVSTILSPQFTDSTSDSVCPCNYKTYTTRPKPKVKWAPNTNNNPNTFKTTTSKYHTRCLPRPQKTKIKITVPKKLIVSNAVYCDDIDTGEDAFKNECYCRKPKISPLLPCNPFNNQTPCIKNDTDRDKSLKSEITSSHSLPTLRKAKELLDYTPESEFLKRLRKEAKEKFDCQCAKCKLEDESSNLKFTANRQLLEEHYDEAKKYNINEICRGQHCCRQDTDKERRIYKNLPPYSTYDSSVPKLNAADCRKIHKIRHIRDENYFDCHSTAHLDRQSVPEHVCSHKFTLNERLLPKATNTDAYGVSRCTICDKPMENVFIEHKTLPTSCNVETTEEKYDSASSNFVNIQSNISNTEYLSKAVQTTPKSSRKHIIYLNVIPLIADPRKLKMKYVPDSWALRYQKMDNNCV